MDFKNLMRFVLVKIFIFECVSLFWSFLLFSVCISCERFFYLLALAVADSMAIVFDGLVDGIDCMKTSKLFAFNNELCVFGWLPSSFLYNKLI